MATVFLNFSQLALDKLQSGVIGSIVKLQMGKFVKGWDWAIGNALIEHQFVDISIKLAPAGKRAAR